VNTKAVEQNETSAGHVIHESSVVAWYVRKGLQWEVFVEQTSRQPRMKE